MNRSFKIACAAALGLVSVAAIGGQSAEAASCAINAVATGGRIATACGGVFDTDSVANPGQDLIAAGLFSEHGVDAPWEVFGASNDGDRSVVAWGGAWGGWAVDFGAKQVDAFVIGVKTDDAFSVFLFDKLDPATTSYFGGYNTFLAGLIGDGRTISNDLQTAQDAVAKAEAGVKTAASDAWTAKVSGDRSEAKAAERRYEDAQKRLRSAEKELAKQEKEERKRTSHDETQRQFGGFGKTPEIIVGTFPTSNVTSAVPVPAALPLMASAFALVGGLAWRRRRAAAK